MKAGRQWSTAVIYLVTGTYLLTSEQTSVIASILTNWIYLGLFLSEIRNYAYVTGYNLVFAKILLFVISIILVGNYTILSAHKPKALPYL